MKWQFFKSFSLVYSGTVLKNRPAVVEVMRVTVSLQF